MSSFELDIVAPVYNESEGISKFIHEVTDHVLTRIPGSRLILVDDGSCDNSFEIIKAIVHSNQNNILVLRLTRNFGHQKAVLAGLEFSSASYVAIIDADLQDPPKFIPIMYEMIRDSESGPDGLTDIIYGERKQRGGETLFKKVSAKLFYIVLRKLAVTAIPLNTGDFRVVSRRAVDEVLKMKHAQPFLRGQFALTSYSSVPYLYEREARFAGKTKYTLRKMIRLASDAIFGFSDYPLQLALKISLVGVLFSFTSATYIVWEYFNTSRVSGWASIFFFVVLFGSLNLLVLSMIGRYVADIWKNSVNHPTHVVREVINQNVV